MPTWLKNLMLGDRTFGAIRHPLWREVQAEHIKKFPNCAVTGKKGTFLNPLNVHHIIPVHIDPSKELDPDNLITLSRWWHFWLGHLGSWFSFNKDVKKDAEIWYSKIKNRPQPGE